MSEDTTRIAGHAAVVAAGLATIGMVGALAGEIVVGADFMGTPAAQLLGWCSFAAACALVLGVAGLGGRLATARERASWAVLLLGTAATTGAAATLALVVPALTDRAPDLANNPPAAVPVTFIVSGLVMGVSGIVLALGLRASIPTLPRAAFLLTVVGSVVAILPLPSRFFLLAFGVATVLRHLAEMRESGAEQQRLAVRAG